MRVTVQLVPAQKASCAAASAKPPADLVEMAVVDRSDARCTRYSGPAYAVYRART